ncbi:hypothetical protein SDC9_122244 [bioreactor metagenome]|uniref:Uncharacterized protein n=1 Tax=bioreactor metagenome TaxID=1076179 RepID=A0A645CEH0_9ZZZZ
MAINFTMPIYYITTGIVSITIKAIQKIINKRDILFYNISLILHCKNDQSAEANWSLQSLFLLFQFFQ